MQTLEELEDLASQTEKELISLDYNLKGSLNYPEIDSTVRAFRKHVFEFSNAVTTIRNQLREKIQAKLKED